MRKGVSKMLLAFLLVGSSLTYFFYPYETSAAFFIGPFGGDIVFTRFCLDGELLTVIQPGGTPWQYIYVPGVTVTHLWIPPSHPDQWILGQSVSPFICINPISLNLIDIGSLIGMEGAGI